MSSVRYIPAISTDAGAVPVSTEVATHPRAGDGYEVQDVFIDPQSFPLQMTRADDFYNDAFQRLRVSDTDQRFDAEFKYDKAPLLFDDVSANGGSATFNANARQVDFATGGTATNIVAGLVQHWANPYTPGNSQFIAMTGIINGANLAGRAEVFLRSSVTGSVVEEIIEVTTSGMSWQYSQIFLMDFQSLKVGRIRFGLDMGGLAVKVAEIKNDNEKAFGYWQLADQPTYYKQYNTATYTYTEIGYGDSANAIGFRYRTAVSGSQTMSAICCTVKSEGGGDVHDIAGVRSSFSNGVTKKTVAATMIPILSFQVKGTFNTYANKGIVFPTDLEIATDNPIYYEVRVNPTLTGASYVSVGNDSILNYDISSTAITGGRVVKAGYASTAGNKSFTTSTGILNKAPLGVSAAGVGDIITICALRDGSVSARVGASMDFNEVR